MGAALGRPDRDRQRVVPEILDTVYYDGKEVTIGRKPIFILPKI
jgi:hypothetical protein